MKSNKDPMDFSCKHSQITLIQFTFLMCGCLCVSLRPTTCVECVKKNPYFLNIIKPALFTSTFDDADVLCTLVQDQHFTQPTYLNFLLPMHQSPWFNNGLFYLLDLYKLLCSFLIFLLEFSQTSVCSPCSMTMWPIIKGQLTFTYHQGMKMACLIHAIITSAFRGGGMQFSH